MVLNPQELSLNIKPTFIPKTISEFLGELSTIRNVSEKLLELDNFINRFEDEMRKIDAFKRELPISVLLISDAITVLKEELIQCRRTNVEPVFEEFIPLKKSSDEAENDENTEEEEERREKKNWLSSVQLWNNTDDENTRDSNVNCNVKPNSVAECVKKSEQETDANVEDVYQPCKDRAKGTVFMPFNFPVAASRKEVEKETLPVMGLSLVTPGIVNPRVELGYSALSSKSSSSIAVSSSSPNVQSNCWTSSQSSRKPRRCWSPELHRRFVGALQQLGGSQAATPKQIRELMQVDGLTNDEVKSHLQKYRLHTRRSPTNKSAESARTLGSELWICRDGESSSQTHSKSSSPEGPLQLTDTNTRTSRTVCDIMEDEGDERSESYSWKTRVQASGKVAV